MSMSNFVSEIDRLRSVTLVVKDLSESIEFYTKTWGLHVVHQGEHLVQLRARGQEHMSWSCTKGRLLDCIQSHGVLRVRTM